jgi:hypothetical protein
VSETIFKYALSDGAAEPFTIEMPQGAAILHVGTHGNYAQLWARVDPEKPTEKRVFYIVGTGWDLKHFPADMKYLATVVLSVYVWHVFEVGSARSASGEQP